MNLLDHLITIVLVAALPLYAALSWPGAKSSYATHLALRTRLTSEQGLTTYYNNIHRDWAWGDEENTASVELVLQALGSGGLQPATRPARAHNHERGKR